MSQRSAWIAAAIATAEVSEPPRPSVVMRPVSLCMPWKPAITATSPRSLKRLISSAPLTSRMRAAAVGVEVTIGNCQPCQERALTPIPSSTMREQPGGDLLAGGDHGVVFAGVVQGRGLAGTSSTSSLVLPAMAETTTATSWPASTSRLTWLRDVADSVEIGDRGSAELHHEAGHGRS